MRTKKDKNLDLDNIVISWNDIADYLGRSPMTAQLYEKTGKLKVYRFNCSGRSNVYAHKADLDKLKEYINRPKKSCIMYN